jgi:glycine oxidase
MSAVRSPGPGSSPDVVVIGGGIVGVATATHLAAAGRRVHLFEIEALAAGASGRNSGVVQHPFDPVFVDLHLETVALYRDLEVATDGALRLPPAPVGLLSVTPDHDAARRLAEALAALYPHLRPTYLSADEVHALEPSIAPDIAACRLDIGYPIAPAAATRAYADWAVRLGVAISVGIGARPWIEDGAVRGVQTVTGERISAADVVVAAGPWTPSLVDPTGEWRPIRPLWGVVVTVGLDTPPSHVLEEAEIDIEPGPDKAEPGHAFSLVTAAGASSLGSTFLDDQPDPAALVPSLVERGRRFVPEIGTARLGAHRVCARPLSGDGRPLIGRVPGIDGLWVAAGHGPWGISTGPASGRLLADLINGTVARPPAALDPARFGPVRAD